MAVFNIEGYNSYSGCDITVTASLPMINGEAVGKYYTLGSIQTLSISTHQDKRPVRSLGVINAKDYVMGPRTIAGSMVFAVFNKHFASDIMADLGAAAGKDVVLPDEIPALDITINFANEYGRMSRMAIYGVKLINEGQVMSINDLYTENTYQFVALGLEPLTSEGMMEGSDWMGRRAPMPSKYEYYIADSLPESKSEALKTKAFEDNTGVNISNQIKNNDKLIVENLPDAIMDLKSNPMIELFVETTDAESELDLGFAVFVLKPLQVNGCIYIYKGSQKLSEADYTLNVTKNASHNMFLPVGTYTAQYMNLSGGSSNIVTFIIGIKDKSEFNNNDNSYPIIDKVTHDSIVVKNNDIRFNIVNIFKPGGEIESYDIGKTPVTLIGLDSNSEYNIFTSNDLSDRSNIMTVKTFEFKNQELEMLKDYVVTNKNLFTSNYNEVLEHLENVNMNDYDTVLDAVMDIPDSIGKDELTIYAALLTNQLIDSYNALNPNHIAHKIQDHLFSNEIGVRDYNKSAVYVSNNRKNKINQIFDSSKESFFGVPNKHYYVCGLNEDNESSVKKDFAILRNTYIEELKEYTNTDNYKDLDLSFYIDKYKKYDPDTIQSIAIMDNCHSDLNLLEPPYIYKESNNKIYADVKYDTLIMDQTYYLVCANIYDSLDSVPFRKIPFTFETNVLILDDYYLGLHNNNNYLFWIEDSNYIKISKPFIYRNHEFYDMSDEFDDYYKNITYSKINKTQAEFNKLHVGNNTTKELFNYIYDLNPAEKNFNEIMTTELLTRYRNSIYENSIHLALFDMLQILNKDNKINKPFGITIDERNKCVKIDTLKDFYICAINFTEDGTIRNINSKDIVYYNDEGYLMIYLYSDTMIYKTGFILLDCKTNKFLCTDDLINCVNKGVIY